MNNEHIELYDWYRFLLGDTPPEFMIEAVIRITLVYIVLIASLRLMGRRMEAMISRGEMVSLVTLGASVGVAIHTPDRGILASMLIIVMILCMQHLQAWLTARKPKIEGLVLDEISTVVKDGRFLLADMKKSRATRERVMAALRGKGIYNLGQVERAYFESKGIFTTVTYRDKEPRKGLCILPDFDRDFHSEFEFSANTSACRHCANLEDNIDPHTKCRECGRTDWEKAIVTEE